jgi:hypothetical protein
MVKNNMIRQAPRRQSRLAVWGIFVILGLSRCWCARAQEVKMEARIDINGMAEKIDILIVSPPKGGTAHIATWNKDPADNKRYAAFNMPASKTQWRKMSFSFMPAKSGEVMISLRGMWSVIDGVHQRNWVRFDDITITDSVLKNGDFEKVIGDSPRDWDLPEHDGFRAVLLKGANKIHSGNYAIEVTHDQSANQIIKVKADTIVTVTAWEMASPDF